MYVNLQARLSELRIAGCNEQSARASMFEPWKGTGAMTMYVCMSSSLQNDAYPQLGFLRTIVAAVQATSAAATEPANRASENEI
jgi:hypothetical protein